MSKYHRCIGRLRSDYGEHESTRKVDGGKKSICLPIGNWPDGWRGIVFSEEWTRVVLGQGEDTKAADGVVFAANHTLCVGLFELKKGLRSSRRLSEACEQLQSSAEAVGRLLSQNRPPNIRFRVAVVYDSGSRKFEPPCITVLRRERRVRIVKKHEVKEIAPWLVAQCGKQRGG